MTYNYEELDVDEVRELLRGWRENNERKSEDVVELWEAVLEDKPSKLGNEKHVILEQVIFASLDCHRYEVAEKCIKTLSEEFPGSLRVMRYQAMKLEAMERYDEAVELLDKLISRDETNAAPRKRKVAILKARGKTTEAIKELVEYLKKFMSDVEGWQQLCDLYLSVGEYSKAVFCAEELILHHPHSHFIHQRVADIRYTMGGVENLELARTYYCQALKLNPDSMRALLGLYLTCHQLASQYKSSGTASKRKEVSRASAWALRRVTAQYAAAVTSGPLADQSQDQLEGLLLTLAITN